MNNRRITQAHGAFLIIFTIPFFFYINSVPFTGAGMYGFMKDNFWAVGGFSQAYMIMAFFGLSLIVGSRQSSSTVWNWIGAAPHLVFLILYALSFSQLYEGIGSAAYGGVVIHGVWAVLEIIGAFLPAQNKARA